MSIPTTLLTTTCDIYRPFGGVLVASSVPCRLVPELQRGRGSHAGSNYLVWTHRLDVEDTVDVRDGCGRTAGLDFVVYGDGDEVRVPGGAGTTRYVVVWVEMVNRGTAVQFKRAYLLRDTPAWPGP